jgi:hypothetical protein
VRGKDQTHHLSGDWGQAVVLTLKMKNSSMNMAPKGRIPAMRMLQQSRGVNSAEDLAIGKSKLPTSQQEHSVPMQVVVLKLLHAVVPL